MRVSVCALYEWRSKELRFFQRPFHAFYIFISINLFYAFGSLVSHWCDCCLHCFLATTSHLISTIIATKRARVIDEVSCQWRKKPSNNRAIFNCSQHCPSANGLNIHGINYHGIMLYDTKLK